MVCHRRQMGHSAQDRCWMSLSAGKGWLGLSSSHTTLTLSEDSLR